MNFHTYFILSANPAGSDNDDDDDDDDDDNDNPFDLTKGKKSSSKKNKKRAGKFHFWVQCICSATNR